MQLTTRTNLSMVKMERKNRLPCMWMPEKSYKKWEGSTKALLHTQLARNSEGRGSGRGHTVWGGGEGWIVLPSGKVVLNQTTLEKNCYIPDFFFIYIRGSGLEKKTRIVWVSDGLCGVVYHQKCLTNMR